MSDFSFIAPVYDLLKKLVFGNILDQSEKHFANKVCAGDSVMILGGGTGKILEYLPPGCQVTYIEVSRGMLARARQRKSTPGDVQFIRADFLEISALSQYNFIICNFFLDVFPETVLRQIIEKIRVELDPDGKLIVTDFRTNGKTSHFLLLRFMHLFFRVVADLQSKKLVDISLVVQQNGFILSEMKTFGNNGIFSAIFRKEGNPG